MENAILKEVVDKVKITSKNGFLPNKISVRSFVSIAISTMVLVGLGETTYTETVDGVEYSYTISSGQATIKDAKVGDETVLKIPSSLGGYDVTSIGSMSFFACAGLTSVTIPSGVKSIGSSAFSCCSGLTSLTFPSSVTNIGSSAFYECSGLTAVTMPNSLTCIEYAAFEGCASLSSVMIPNSVTSIRRRAFINCCNLTSIVIPSSVKSIGMEAFRGCSELASVTIPSSVTSIGDYAFMDCSGLTSVSIHDGVKSIGSYAFGFCGALMSVTIPSSVTSIGDYAFYWCECLSSVTIPEGVTYVGEGAFAGCGEAICNETINDVEYSYTISSSKATITNAKVGDKAVVRIPSSLGGCEVTSIGHEAFSGCSELESVMIPQGVTRIGEYAFFDCSRLTSVTIPEGVTSIGSRAFSGCVGLTSAAIPSSVMSIGSYAFNNCSGLMSVEIPSRVSSIGDGAFEDCSGLKSITVDPMSRNYCSINGLLCSKDGKTLIQGANGDVNIPEGVTSIGARAFSGCSRLTSVLIPLSVTSIGSYAFNNCSGLTSVVMPSKVSSIGSYAFSGCSSLVSVVIPSSVTSIGLYAFNDCSGLTSVTMPSCVSRLSSIFSSAYDKIREVIIDEGVTSIESQAFFGCGNLTSVTIPSTVTSIGDYAFCGCSGLTSVMIPSGVTRIGIAAFYDCRGLTSLIIPLSVTSVGARAFFGCCGLQSVSIPSSMKSISDYVFCGCSGLASVTIPLGVTRIGEHAFSDCSGLTSVTIPSSVTGIGAYAFSGCSGLITVTMPSCVRSLSQIYTSAYNKIHEVIICEGTTSIGQNMFDGCEGVTSVRIPSTVTDIDDKAFYDCGGVTSFSVSSDNPSYQSISGLLCSKDGCQVVCGVNGDVSIPPGVLNIRDYAFAWHDGLTSVVIPESVTSIGNSSFVNCRALKSVKIPLNVRNIGRYAFGGCGSVSSVTTPVHVMRLSELLPDSYETVRDVVISDGETCIKDYAFSGCRGLKSLTIPDSVTDIGSFAFSGCEGLKLVSIPDCVTSIGEYAFSGCYHLTSVTIPAHMMSIEKGLFRMCVALESVEIPSGVTSVSEESFYSCSRLKSLTIPDSVANIGECAFSGCDGLADDDGFIIVRDVLYGYVGTKENIEILGIVSRIERGAFGGCSCLKVVTVPSNVTNIGAEAFRGCNGLSLVLGMSGVTNIGDYAFYNCPSLARMCLPSDATIGLYAIPETVLIIQRVSVAVNGSERQYVYDGTGKKYSAELIPDMDQFKVENVTNTLPFSLPNVGAYQLELAPGYFWNTNEDYDVTFTVDFERSESEVVITPRPVMVMSGSAEKVYDGTPLACARTDVGDAGFVADECEVMAVGSQTAVGVVKNTITLNWSEDALPTNYTITKQEGTLTVLPAQVSSDGEEPWGGDGPRPYVGGEGVHSLYSTTSVYDGLGHTIDVETLSKIKLVGGDVPQISYALTSNGVYRVEPIYFTNACFTSVWYKVMSPNHNPYIHEAGVIINPRNVRLKSGSATKNYDGTPLRYNVVTVLEKERPEDEDEGFVPGDGATFNCTGSQTCVGLSPNVFDYVLNSGTLESNYSIGCEYGTLTVTATGVVSIASGVTEIPAGALKDCAEVTEIRIPDTVRYIGDGAFAGCTGLEKIVFPSRMELRWNELRRIGLTDEFVRTALVQGDWLVAGCVLLAYVGDPNVSELMVPDGIEIIEEEVFAGLYNLQKIHFCGTEKEIGPFAFRDCTYLDDVVLPDTVEVLGEGAFSGCSYIFDFDMGNGVREIGESAFEGCQTIENIVCSTNLLDVGRRAFADCYYLRDVALPLGVTNVATSAFAGCAALTGVTVPTHVVPLSRWFPEQYKSICSVTIPDDETEMVPSMFEGCQSLGIDPADGAESIILPEGMTVIPDRAFADCSSIVQLTLPTGVVSIGEAAFERCQFVAFEMPDAVTIVGKGAFRGCSALKDVTLAKSLMAIPDELFAGCASLDSFTVPGCVAQLGANFVPYQTSAIYFMSNAPVYAANAYDSANVHELVNYVKRGTMGWNGQLTGRVLPTPAVWPANTVVPIKYWEANQFEAVFDANGGYFANSTATTFACKETTFESYAIPPYDPIRPGYVFTGWWTDPTGGSRIRSTTRVTLTKPNDEVQTIYAHWKKGEAKWVTIRFNAMGGTVSPAFTNCIVGEIYGNALKSVVPTKEYYDFYGWYTMAYWPDGELQTAETIVPDADRELFARWEPKTYVVRYHANGGTGTMADGTFVYGDKFNLAANQFKRAGHAFAGWASTADGAKKYNDGAELSDFGAIEDGVVNLYAVWVAVDCYYSIRFDSNGGVGTMTNQTVRIGDTVPLDPNRFTRTGYAFAGWALRADDYEKVYDDQEHVCNLSETDGDTVALFAVWVKAEEGVAVPVVSTASGSTFFGESCEVTITCATAGATIYCAVGASPRAVARYVYSGPFTISETSTVYAFAKKGDKKTDTVKVVITKRTLTLAEAIGAEDLLVTTGGLTGWNPVVDASAAKGVSARSSIMKAAEPGEWNESWMEIVVDGPGTLTFRWKVDCEWDESGDCTWDHLAYFVDNAVKDSARIDGTAAWERRSVTFETPGPHSVRWVFAKDDYDDEFYGEDCGWVEDVTWVPAIQGAVVPSEITGGKEIVVDESWPASLDAQFGAGTSAAFVEKFGSDLLAALLKSTGKKSASGEEMYVWQDYVAGTDPTDPKSQFTAKIEMVDGNLVVIWSPKLSEAEAAKRVYTTYGKKTLEAAEPWTPIETPALGGWWFFKVGVEMR